MIYCISGYTAYSLYMKRLLLFVFIFFLFNVAEPLSALAAEKEVTYREQNSSEDTNLVFLKVGEKIDLKFIGASDYKNYTCEWTTSDKSVVTINQSGVVTAKKEGTAVVKIVIKNSSYVTKGCMIVVSKQYNAVEIADDKNKTLQELTLEKGSTKQLYVKNLNTYCSGAYSMEWISDNASVVKVNNGLLTGNNAGTATIRVQVRNLSTGEVLPNIPLKVNVPGKVTVTPTPMPKITATPAPTAAPSATPVPKDAVFVTEVLGDSKIKLVFPEAVSDVSLEDIHITYSKAEYAVSSISWNTEKTEAVLTLTDILKSGTSYALSIDGYEKKISFKPVFQAPDKVVLSWESLGVENKAYTQNPKINLDIPTTLSVNVYANGLDVTRTWEWTGYVEYKLLNAGNISFDFHDDYLLFYDVGDKALISAEFTFTYNKKEYTLTTGTSTIVAEKVPEYRIIGVTDYGFLPADSTAMVDWKNPKTEVIANDTKEHVVITRFMDNYGYSYASDKRGVNETMGLRSIDDRNTPFGALHWGISYEGNGKGFYVDDNGGITAFGEVPKCTILVKVEGQDAGNSIIGAFETRVTAPRRLATITAQQNEIELCTDAMEGHEEFVSIANVPIVLRDQYGALWTDYSDLELTVDGKLSNVACHVDNGVLSVDASHMEAINGTAIITISSEDGKIKEKITVSLKAPSYDRNNEIVVSGWNVADDMTISALPDKVYDLENTVRINPYHVSRTTKIGIMNESIFPVANADKKYSASSCVVGDVYLSVTDSKNKALSVLGEGKKGLGIRKGEDGSIVLVTSYQDSFGKFHTLAAGEYTVTVVYVRDIIRDQVVTMKKTQKITILDEIPEVSIGDKKMSVIEFLPTNQETAKVLASECMQIFVDGVALDNFTVDKVGAIGYSSKNNRFTVSSLDVWVPSTKNDSMLVKVTIKGINQVFDCERNENKT